MCDVGSGSIHDYRESESDLGRQKTLVAVLDIMNQSLSSHSCDCQANLALIYKQPSDLGYLFSLLLFNDSNVFRLLTCIFLSSHATLKTTCDVFFSRSIVMKPLLRSGMKLLMSQCICHV